jgi:hypothetical protein
MRTTSTYYSLSLSTCSLLSSFLYLIASFFEVVC